MDKFCRIGNHYIQLAFIDELEKGANYQDFDFKHTLMIYGGK